MRGERARNPSAQGRRQVPHDVLQQNHFDPPPDLAANSTISLRSAKVAGPARPNLSWFNGTNRHAPVPVRLYL